MAIVNGTMAYAKLFIGMSVRSTMNAKKTPMTSARQVEPMAKIAVLDMTVQVVGLVQAWTKKVRLAPAARAAGPRLIALSSTMTSGASTRLAINRISRT